MATKIISKRCSKCKEIKSISEFYHDRKPRDRFKSWCKLCRKKYRQSPKGKAAHKHYQQSEKGKVADRIHVKHYHQSEKGKATWKRYLQSKKGKATRKRYLQSEKGKAYRKRAIQKRQKFSPLYSKIIGKVNYEIQAGRLTNPTQLPCHYCGKPAKQYHHHLGYELAHWFDVLPVCIPCHKKIHVKLL